MRIKITNPVTPPNIAGIWIRFPEVTNALGVDVGAGDGVGVGVDVNVNGDIGENCSMLVTVVPGNGGRNPDDLTG